MIDRFICIGLELPVSITTIDKTFSNNKNYQDNSRKHIKCVMSFLQITYLFTLGKTLLIYFVNNQLWIKLTS